MSDLIILDQLEVECVIGVFDWERKVRQKVHIGLELECDVSSASRTDDISHTVDYKAVAKAVSALVEPSEFFLIETMAERIAGVCLSCDGVQRATVTVSKPGAVRGSRNVSVKIVRPSGLRRVFLGVGANIDPLKNIPAGLELIGSRFRVVRVSPVYRSEPWGVKSAQPDYYNLAVEAQTDRDVFSVRGELCWIEKMVGRLRNDDKFAPRTLDVDLLVYDGLAGKFAGGVLPHPQLLTQQFVHLPMMDIAPWLTVPGCDKTLREITPEYDNVNLRIEKLPDTF